MRDSGGNDQRGNKVEEGLARCDTFLGSVQREPPGDQQDDVEVHFNAETS